MTDVTTVESETLAQGSQKRRVQLDLSAKMCSLIDRLVERMDASSRAEVVRRAVSVYAVLLDEHDDGKRVEVNDTKTGERQRVVLP